MKLSLSPQTSARRFAAPTILSLALAAACARAQTSLPGAGAAGDQLEPVIVTATRTPEDIRTLGSAVDFLTPADLARQQIETFEDALGDVPGVPAFSNGGRGSDVSVFMRGSNSDQTLFLVDGIRMNDPNVDYAVFLGGARLGAADSIAIVRGPQSTLYGSEAVGGVISLSAQKGAGNPSAAVSAEAGSFGTVSGEFAAQGARDGWAYSFSVSGGKTENQRSNNEFDDGNAVLRLDRTLTPNVSVGATLRGFTGLFGDPGDEYTDAVGDYERENNWLGSLFADLRIAPDWTAHITIGGQDRRYIAVTATPGFPDSAEVERNRRAIVDAQTTYSGFGRQKITVGITAEADTTLNTGYGDIDNRQTLFAAFAEDEWHPLNPIYLTAGLRYDDFDTFGSATTGRVTAAWLSADKAFKVRGSYGTGFSSPSFLELYGVADGYVGNPNLRPERAAGGDAGFDWYLPGNRGSFSASWFRTDYRDLIEYNFNVYPGTTENIDRARTQGVELEFRYALPGRFEARATYTYLEAVDLTEMAPLLRRPRNSGGADLWRDLGGGFDAGAGVEMMGERPDVDAFTFEDATDPSYTVARVYAAWKANEHLVLRLRVENLLNRGYVPVNGYPALGRGIFGGVEWKF